MNRSNQAKIITNMLNAAGMRLEPVYLTDKTFIYHDRDNDLIMAFEGSDMYADPATIDQVVDIVGQMEGEDTTMINFPYFYRLHYELFKFVFDREGIEMLLPLHEIFENDKEIFDHPSEDHGFRDGDVLPAYFTHHGLKQLELCLCQLFIPFSHQIVKSLADIFEERGMMGGMTIYPTGSPTDPMGILAIPAAWMVYNEDEELDMDLSMQWNIYLAMEVGLEDFHDRLSYFFSKLDEIEDDDD